MGCVPGALYFGEAAAYTHRTLIAVRRGSEWLYLTPLITIVLKFCWAGTNWFKLVCAFVTKLKVLACPLPIWAQGHARGLVSPGSNLLPPTHPTFWVLLAVGVPGELFARRDPPYHPGPPPAAAYTHRTQRGTSGERLVLPSSPPSR